MRRYLLQFKVMFCLFFILEIALAVIRLLAASTPQGAALSQLATLGELLTPLTVLMTLLLTQRIVHSSGKIDPGAESAAEATAVHVLLRQAALLVLVCAILPVTLRIGTTLLSGVNLAHFDFVDFRSDIIIIASALFLSSVTSNSRQFWLTSILLFIAAKALLFQTYSSTLDLQPLASLNLVIPSYPRYDGERSATLWLSSWFLAGIAFCVAVVNHRRRHRTAACFVAILSIIAASAVLQAEKVARERIVSPQTALDTDEVRSVTIVPIKTVAGGVIEGNAPNAMSDDRFDQQLVSVMANIEVGMHSGDRFAIPTWSTHGQLTVGDKSFAAFLKPENGRIHPQSRFVQWRAAATVIGSAAVLSIGTEDRQTAYQAAAWAPAEYEALRGQTAAVSAQMYSSYYERKIEFSLPLNPTQYHFQSTAPGAPKVGQVRVTGDRILVDVARTSTTAPLFDPFPAHWSSGTCYVLVNRNRNEALFAHAAKPDLRLLSEPSVNDYRIEQVEFKLAQQHSGKVDAEWLRDAELVGVAYAKLGHLKHPVETHLRIE